jgi:hypothetical protein
MERSSQQIIADIPRDEFVTPYVMSLKGEKGKYTVLGFSLKKEGTMYPRMTMSSKGGRLTDHGHQLSAHSIEINPDFMQYSDRQHWGNTIVNGIESTHFRTRLLIKAAQNCEKKYTPKEAAKAVMAIKGSMRTSNDSDFNINETIAFHEGIRKLAQQTPDVTKQRRESLKFVESGGHYATEYDEGALISLAINKKEFMGELAKTVFEYTTISNIGSYSSFENATNALFGKNSFLRSHKSIVQAILKYKCR